MVCFKSFSMLTKRQILLSVGKSRFISSVLDMEQRIADSLKLVIEPLTQKSLNALGSLQSVRISKDGIVKVDLDLFVAGYPFIEQVTDQCRSAVVATGCANDVEFCLAPMKKFASVVSSDTSTLGQVGHVIAISSCKGGVGKSTVAVNIAMTLSQRGLRVGILDADVYGPSLPLLLEAESLVVKRSAHNAKHVLPLQSAQGGLKMLSFGHVNPKSGAPGSGGRAAAVVRGPIVSKIITQLLHATEWGDLDYLIIDMPPGTGDIQITLTQGVSLTGAVIVTTPHALSVVDAAKGVAMFEDLKVPTLALVENMSHFSCEHGTKYFPFGRGGREKLLRGLSSAGSTSEEAFNQLHNCPMRSLPLVMAPDFRLVERSLVNVTSSDHQCSASCTHDDQPSSTSVTEEFEVLPPVVWREPQSESAQVYSGLTDDILSEIFKMQTEAILTPSVSYNERMRCMVLRYFAANGATEFVVPIEELRMRDAKTGALVAGRTKEQFAGVSPVTLDFKGKYGVAVVWSDGHFADIFPYPVLRHMAEKTEMV